MHTAEGATKQWFSGDATAEGKEGKLYSSNRGDLENHASDVQTYEFDIDWKNTTRPAVSACLIARMRVREGGYRSSSTLSETHVSIRAYVGYLPVVLSALCIATVPLQLTGFCIHLATIKSTYKTCKT